MEEEGAYGVAFSCLPCPSGGNELAALELAYEFGLVGGWGEAEGFGAEFNGVCWDGEFSFLVCCLLELSDFPFEFCHGHCFSSSPIVLRSSSNSVLIWVMS